MKRKLVSFVAVIILMAGCNPASISQSIASKTPILENPTPTETKTGFFTPIPEVIPPPNGIKYHCVDISNDAAKLSNMDGTLVLAGHLVPITTGKSFSNPSLLIDVSTGDQIVLIADDSTDRFVISPSGNLLAFDVWEGNSSNKWQINVLNSKGNILTKFVEEDLESIEWLNDKTLLLNSMKERFGNHPLIFLSPFDQKEDIVEPFITEAERIMASDHELIYGWGFYAFHKIIYNSSLTRAIYAASDQDGAKVIFRDLVSNEDLSALRSHEAWGVSPKWSPDGTKLAIGMDMNLANNKRIYELVILDQNGKQFFATQLSMLSGSVYLSSLSWSPDGNHVAFWYTTNEDINRDLRLAVFDIQSQTTVDYCITNNSVSHMWHRNDMSPLWSPDGDFLLIESSNTDDDNHNVVILDLIREQAAIIKTGYEPVGWMK